MSCRNIFNNSDYYLIFFGLFSISVKTKNLSIFLTIFQTISFFFKLYILFRCPGIAQTPSQLGPSFYQTTTLDFHVFCQTTTLNFRENLKLRPKYDPIFGRIYHVKTYICMYVYIYIYISCQSVCDIKCLWHNVKTYIYIYIYHAKVFVI